jgi:Co/Zn/Cd efflux system component
MQPCLLEKIDTFIGKVLIILLCFWTVFEAFFSFYKTIFIGHETLLLGMRVFAITLFFVMMYFFDMDKHDDGKPATSLETAGSILFIFGSIISLVRVLHFWHPIFVILLWIILFIVAIWKHVKISK